MPVHALLDLIAHLYFAMWSNMWAPSAWTLLALLAAHVHIHRNIKHHKIQLDTVSQQITDLSHQLEDIRHLLNPEHP